MNNTYWSHFYKTFKTLKNSSFSEFCLNYINKEIIDLGCGNGRDSYFFAKKGIKVIGIDKANLPKSIKNAVFIKQDFNHFRSFNKDIYARFFLHSINNENILKLIEMSNKRLMLEFRDKNDSPVIYKHPRNKVDGNIILSLLLKNNFNILYYKKDINLAKFKKENPLICRIVAEKKF